MCHSTHKMSNALFPVNESIVELLAKSPTSHHPFTAYRVDSVETLKSNLSHLESDIKEIENNIKCTDQLKEICVKLRKDVDSNAKKAIQEINYQQKAMNKQIDDYENEENNNRGRRNPNDLYESLEQKINRIKKFCHTKREYLKHTSFLEEAEVSSANNKAVKFKIDMDTEIKFYENEKKISFEQSGKKIEKNHLGVIRIKRIINNNDYDDDDLKVEPDTDIIR